LEAIPKIETISRPAKEEERFQRTRWKSADSFTL
jgi:hypothetical protein